MQQCPIFAASGPAIRAEAGQTGKFRREECERTYDSVERSSFPTHGGTIVFRGVRHHPDYAFAKVSGGVDGRFSMPSRSMQIDNRCGLPFMAAKRESESLVRGVHPVPQETNARKGLPSAQVWRSGCGRNRIGW